jgi:aerobic-type carbon monoxide dehydrogenase small subunit (CoxS/CutS family)
LLREYSFKLNGKPVVVKAPPAYNLLETLRNVLGLTGTKNGCSEGECGACTVLMNGRAVHSCLTIMEQVRGADVVTIEGLAKDPESQTLLRRFVEEGAVQCGYCTPGIVMTSKELLAKNPRPSAEEVREALRGNLCRCTGYSKVVKAVMKGGA